MNSDEIWLLELWSGTFGAAISAVAAALVAVLVLYFSNKHQTKLAKKARKAAVQDLKKQMKLQRDEASRERASHAIAEMLTEIDTNVTGLQDGAVDLQQLIDMRVRFTTASARWSMELDNEAMELELTQWPSFLFDLAREVIASGSDSRNRWAQLVFSSSILRDHAMQWYSRNGLEQQESAEALKAHRLKHDPRRQAPRQTKVGVDDSDADKEGVS